MRPSLEERAADLLRQLCDLTGHAYHTVPTHCAICDVRRKLILDTLEIVYNEGLTDG
jgi:hypothetical protein